jgi:hypothetical protein
MNKKLITFALLIIVHTRIFAQEIEYKEITGSNSCCSSRYQKPITCSPRISNKKTYRAYKSCSRRCTGFQRWRSSCGPLVRKCRPKRACCPRLRCCKPRPACCKPASLGCEAEPCLTENGHEGYDKNRALMEEASAAAGPIKTSHEANEMAIEDEESL